MVVTLAITAWSVSTVPVDGGAVGYGLRFVALLVAPLRILRIGSESATALVQPDALEGLAYGAMGVPFLFVVLPLREYFRSPLGGKPGGP